VSNYFGMQPPPSPPAGGPNIANLDLGNGQYISVELGRHRRLPKPNGGTILGRAEDWIRWYQARGFPARLLIEGIDYFREESEPKKFSRTPG
jgi:hypothetical protein